MRIVIDLQGAQAGNARRGIGHYTRALVTALLEHGSAHEYHLLFNEGFADTTLELRRHFARLLPFESMHGFHPPASPAPEDATVIEQTRALRTASLARLQPDWVLITSLFEGPHGPACIDIEPGQAWRTAVVLYDLIPLMHPDIYLSDPQLNRWYHQQLAQLQHADLLLGISGYTSESAARLLPTAANRRIETIGTGIDPTLFYPEAPAGQSPGQPWPHPQIHKPYLLYTGGIDPRKNLPALIESFALLPAGLRDTHQLVIVCQATAHDQANLQQKARACQLPEDALVLTGHVPLAQLRQLYNRCRLFVFPSWQEGFGLPVAEAMACGAPVIVSDTGSLPELIPDPGLRFDPHAPEDIARCIARLLNDDRLRATLARTNPEHAARHRWPAVAQRALDAMQASSDTARTSAPPAERPTLAYFSPMPPARSGIADYSAMLLPALARHYDITVIPTQGEAGRAQLPPGIRQESLPDFLTHPKRYQRLLYNFGNSHFHLPMFDCLREHPGVVLLHDFFLSGVQGLRPDPLARLYHAHGYAAVAAVHHRSAPDIAYRYPVSLEVLQQALGVVVHSRYASQLAQDWYGLHTELPVLPLVREEPRRLDRQKARQQLGIPQDCFLVCSFGHLGPTKLNHRLLEAWTSSSLYKQRHCRLVFVGEASERDPYSQQLRSRLEALPAEHRPVITGWTSPEQFSTWLAAADLAVQLRTHSRGESSAAVLDALNQGLSVLINANGSLAELPEDIVHRLPDAFTDQALTEALETLHANPQLRNQRATAGQAHLQAHHRPDACAARLAELIEHFSARRASTPAAALETLAARQALPSQAPAQQALARALADTLPPAPRQPVLYLDISELVERDARSGIQRVVRNILRQWLHNPPAGYRTEAVYAHPHAPGFVHAHRFVARFLEIPLQLDDCPIEPRPGDIFLGLDLQPQRIPAQRRTLEEMAAHGVSVQFVVYDLLPVTHPQYFLPGAAEGFTPWLDTITAHHAAHCISRTTADALRQWLTEHHPERLDTLRISHFPLANQFDDADLSHGTPSCAPALEAAMAVAPAWLMVGTLEPRKGHLDVLDAFEQLWAEGRPDLLVIVGRPGWMVEALTRRLEHHPEQGHRLFWLTDCSDAYLLRLYETACALIAASHAEGYGLPLVEAAAHRLPVLARDLPVFREVAAPGTRFFASDAPDALLQALRAPLPPRPIAAPEPTNWVQSVCSLQQDVLAGTRRPGDAN